MPRRLQRIIKGHDVHGNQIEVAVFEVAGGASEYEVGGRPATPSRADEAMAWIDGPWTEERFGYAERIDSGPTSWHPPAADDH